VRKPVMVLFAPEIIVQVFERLVVLGYIVPLRVGAWMSLVIHLDKTAHQLHPLQLSDR
jgi:hypothetical protein